MSTFSTTVTKAQRNAPGQDSWGHGISFCSRHNINSPGYNRSPFEPTPKKIKNLGDALKEGLEKARAKDVAAATKKTKSAAVQVRPNTKRGQRAATPTPKNIQLPELPVETFLESSCELATPRNIFPRNIFIAVYSLSKGKPCVGCAYDEHSKTGCPAKQKLLRERGLIK